ncbi:Bug family tripartite tricarboxylate transporter substrate binding protein [Paracoccus tibetensis]|uniref:Tripartite-type tricarboxylate transporter, receptor component TctC n=1 Tax=Paracoccus tibetensis TaxID=336292 RepID=A0A1G5JJF9_9RHOB|nr:tripartite tricarboxylate transporter substrate binding protein [Paracoccus tibetensis]SCY88304.1 Tripartite-type tricarboxylate transporter, receptor component TctC [Paracoccus tibetensis]
MSRHATTLFAATGMLAALIAPSAALAEYPERPIHIVVAWPAGGGHDIAARLLGASLSEQVGVPVVIDNVTGAGGSTGVRHLEQSDADGYTIGLIGMHAISQSFMNPNATRLDALEPVAYISDDPGALQVTAATGIETLDGYIEAVRADPGALINGNDPQGGNSFVFANALSQAIEQPIVQIPYQGHAPNVTALITNEIASATLPIPPVLEHYRGGTVRILGVMSPERHPMLPDVPTFREQGVDLVANDFVMIAAPTGLDPQIAQTLSAAIVSAVESPTFAEPAERNGMVLRPGDAEMAASELQRQVDLIYPLLESAGLVSAELARQ